MATRIMNVCTTASPVDTQRDAEKVAETLRAGGEFVRLSAIFYMPEGTRKGGLPAIQLEVSDTPFPVKQSETTTGAAATVTSATVPAPIATETSAERPLSFQEMDARDREQARLAAEEAAREVPIYETESTAHITDDPSPGFKNVVPAKKRGGRPKGSKNKPKVAA